ncbi:unnamed protein product, partial [marine sediment metagenome]
MVDIALRKSILAQKEVATKLLTTVFTDVIDHLFRDADASNFICIQEDGTFSCKEKDNWIKEALTKEPRQSVEADVGVFIIEHNLLGQAVAKVMTDLWDNGK